MGVNSDPDTDILPCVKHGGYAVSGSQTLHIDVADGFPEIYHVKQT